MSQYSYDKWLRPRPNIQWQNLENQIFVDQTPLSGQFEADEDLSEVEDDDDTTDGITDIEESNGESEPEDESPDAGYESERSQSLISYTGTQLAADEVFGAESTLARHLNPPGVRDAPARRTGNEARNPFPDDDGIVQRFLTVMEELAVKDRDLYRDSIARLRQFFKTATLRGLEEARFGCISSRILLEDRNFSGKTFRPYPRSMTLNELYEALAKHVRTI